LRTESEIGRDRANAWSRARHLAREGYDSVYGARPLKRAIQRGLLDQLSMQLLDGKFALGATINVDARDGS